MQALGTRRQVLCVTHLPQVAARAEWQWQVSKEIRDGATDPGGGGDGASGTLAMLVGATLWTADEIEATPLVLDDTVYIGASDTFHKELP